MLTKATASVNATQAKKTDSVEASRSMITTPLSDLATPKIAQGSLRK
jgi:hypothetical protein